MVPQASRQHHPAVHPLGLANRRLVPAHIYFAQSWLVPTGVSNNMIYYRIILFQFRATGLSSALRRGSFFDTLIFWYQEERNVCIV